MHRLTLDPFYFGNCFSVRVSRNPDVRTERANLFFHGFPAFKNRHLDLAEETCWKTGQDSYIFHYAGLGKSKGSFSFIDSILDAKAFVQDLIQKFSYESFNVMGHSWGGLVAMSVCIDLGAKLAQLLLLSPLNFIPDESKNEEVINFLCKRADIGYASKNMNEFIKELELIRKEFDPRELVKARIWNQNQVHILQAKQDLDVPETTTREFAKLFYHEARYTELDVDHSFIINRDKLPLHVFQAFQVDPS